MDTVQNLAGALKPPQLIGVVHLQAPIYGLGGNRVRSVAGALETTEGSTLIETLTGVPDMAPPLSVRSLNDPSRVLHIRASNIDAIVILSPSDPQGGDAVSGVAWL